MRKKTKGSKHDIQNMHSIMHKLVQIGTAKWKIQYKQFQNLIVTPKRNKQDLSLPTLSKCTSINNCWVKLDLQSQISTITEIMRPWNNFRKICQLKVIMFFLTRDELRYSRMVRSCCSINGTSSYLWFSVLSSCLICYPKTGFHIKCSSCIFIDT